jgi:hypothetical protein
MQRVPLHRGGWNDAASSNVAGKGAGDLAAAAAAAVKLPPVSRVNPFAAKLKAPTAKAGKKTVPPAAAAAKAKGQGLNASEKPQTTTPSQPGGDSGDDHQGNGSERRSTPLKSPRSSEQGDIRPTPPQQQRSKSAEQGSIRRHKQSSTLGAAADASASARLVKNKIKEDKKAVFR